VKIAIIGTRGVPARYGGFETCAEELSTRLVRRGHNVRVYCRRHLYPERFSDFRGVKLIHLPCLRLKSVETLSHTLFSMVHAICTGVDVLLVFNIANSPICLLPKFFRKRVAINADGLEWKRGKWHKLGRWYLKWAEKIASKYCDVIVADNRCIADYYKSEYQVDVAFIPYGAEVAPVGDCHILDRYGLQKDQYFLTVTRLEPENNTSLTVRAYKSVQTDMPLVIVGSAPYKSSYYRNLTNAGDSRVRFLGAIYERDVLGAIWGNCFAYVHGNEVGGTNPALLQSLAYGNCVLSIDVCFNREVIGDSAILYEKDESDLARKMNMLIANPGIRTEYKDKAIERIKCLYTWEEAVDRYERLCGELSGTR